MTPSVLFAQVRCRHLLDFQTVPYLWRVLSPLPGSPPSHAALETSKQRYQGEMIQSVLSGCKNLHVPDNSEWMSGIRSRLIWASRLYLYHDCGHSRWSVGFHQEKCSTVSEETSSEVQTGLCADGSSSTFHPCVAILVSTTNKYHHVSWCLIWSAIHMHL